MRARLTDNALADLHQIKKQSQRLDIDAAIALDAIWRTLHVLAAWPKLGRNGYIYGTREFLVRRMPFLIIYRVDIGDDDEIVILRIYHVRQSR